MKTYGMHETYKLKQLIYRQFILKNHQDYNDKKICQ